MGIEYSIDIESMFPSRNCVDLFMLDFVSSSMSYDDCAFWTSSM